MNDLFHHMCKGEDKVKYNYHDALAIGEIAHAHPGGFALTKEIIDGERIKPNAIVLDAGCGLGATAVYIAKKKKCQVYAVDLHPKMLQYTKQRFKKENLSAKVMNGNLEQLPFPDDYFDFIIAESVTIFTDIEQSLKEYRRVLKPAGTLINIELTLEETLSEKKLRPLKSFYQIKRFPTEEEWVQFFLGAQFTDVKIVKKKTIFEEIEDTWAEAVPSDLPPEENISDPIISKLLADHSRLMVNYAEELGYRVFKASGLT